jgi:hypothetical protein
MSRKALGFRLLLSVLLMGLLASGPAFAASAVIGSVAGSINATVGGQAILPNTTIYSGDSLQVRDGVAVVAMGGGSRMIFGRETVVSFLRETEEVTVLLGRGNVTLYHPGDSVVMRLKVGDVAISPAKGFLTRGEIAMVGDAIVVSTKEGMLRVEGKGSAVEVPKGKTLNLNAKVASAAPGQAGQAAGAGAAAGAHAGAAGVSTGLQAASLAASGTSMGLSAGAISRASGARNAATQATASANQAILSSNSAASSANAAGVTATAAGCAVNTINSNVNPGSASPFTPPAGGCP